MKLLLVCLASIFTFSALSQQVDLVIKNGKVIDGAGNSWFYADVAVQDGKVVQVARHLEVSGKRVIDASGHYVAPGFIDVHAHIEGDELEVPTADNFIFDGVTSVITGNCGGSNVDIQKYFNQLDSIGMSINVASLIGHNTVRREVMGEGQRDPTVEEQQRMEALVAQAMKDGAVGFSTGLIYVPGTYSKTPEVIGLARASARLGGVYASHIRSEGDEVTAAIEEAVNIGREASMPVQISHFKVTYRPNWGRSVSTIAQVQQARDQGIDVTVDQYPYVASSTTLDTTVPEWAFSGGRDSLYWRLKKRAIREKIKKEMLEGLEKKQLKDYSYAVVARYVRDSTYNGKNISEINLMLGRKPTASDEAETILNMITSGRVQMVYFSMNEDDLQRIMKYPFSMIASDAGIVKFGRNVPHPRAYGTNARVLGRYVRELNTIHLEEAIRRMTSLPAQKFQLKDRGLIREGMVADLVIFDAEQVNDLATFSKPHAYATGFSHVIVNGQVVVADGKHTGVRSGQVLRGPGWSAK